VKKALLQKIEKEKAYLEEVKNDTKAFVEEDVRQTIDDLELVEDAFMEELEELSRTADMLSGAAMEAISEEINAIKAQIPEMKEKAQEVVKEAIEILKEKGQEAAYSAKEKGHKILESMKHEVEELSWRMVKVAKGALSGMVEGAKKALKDEN